MPASRVMLDVVDLHKTFAAPAGQLHVLNGIDMTLYDGEFVAVTGDSGSGKSTLLHVIGTLDCADAGTAMLDGESLFDLPARKIAQIRNRKIGFVYQSHHLIPELNALENVMLPLLVRGEKQCVAKEMADSFLNRLGLQERILHHPGRLSGGEAQRVAVARALVGSPRLLLADEPTGNLDEHTADEVFEAMRDLCRQEGATVMMVTHNMKLAHHCDRKLRLHEGRVMAEQATC